MDHDADRDRLRRSTEPTTGLVQAMGFLERAAHVGRALEALKRAKILDEDNGFEDGLFRHFLRQ